MITKEQAKHAEVNLTETLRILEEKGWIKGSFHNSQGYCLLGAIQKANGNGQDPAKKLVYNCIGSSDIPNWNDNMGRKKDEVLTVIKAAINIAKEIQE